MALRGRRHVRRVGDPISNENRRWNSWNDASKDSSVMTVSTRKSHLGGGWSTKDIVLGFYADTFAWEF